MSINSTNSNDSNLLDLKEALVSGTDTFSKPTEIYNPGHQQYLNYIYGEKTQPDVSGIVSNINLLREGNTLEIVENGDIVRCFNPSLNSDYNIPEDCSGISINLKFGKFNVITTDNLFKNF